jgi:hypothetical protein
MPTSFSDIEFSFEFVSSQGVGINEAFLCRRTGKIYWRSDSLDVEDMNEDALVTRRNVLDRWYEFESKATERALREWCELNSIELAD